MIKTFRQAALVQDRRADSGKRGYAKAVRRFLLREYPDLYQSRKQSLTVVWPKPKVKKKTKKVKVLSPLSMEIEIE